jgi:predicted metalloprotease with PDZ domain
VGGLARVAAEADRLFGGMPYREFAFLAQDEAYGGLEHPASVTVGAPSAELARDPHAALDDASHEFVHTWNLMAIRPAEYGGVTWRATAPVPTLWFGEGLTMYYADLLRRRAGLPADGRTRAAHLERLVARYAANPAYGRLSPEAISRATYNAGPEALGDYSASVHLAGEVVGTALDLMVRDSTAGRRTMDDVMRALYARARRGAPGIATADVERAVAGACGCDPRGFFDAHVRGAAPVDLGRWLPAVGHGLEVTWAPERRADGTPAPDHRVWAWNATEGAPLRLRHQLPTGAWGRAGLHTGDEVTHVNGEAVRSWPEFRRAVGAIQVGDSVEVALAAAGGAPARRVRFVMSGYDVPAVRVRPLDGATARQRALGARWADGR